MCCYITTSVVLGDKAFAEFLNDELKEERKIQKHKSLPKMSGGWEIEVNGTEAKLTRKVSGEKYVPQTVFNYHKHKGACLPTSKILQNDKPKKESVISPSI